MNEKDKTMIVMARPVLITSMLLLLLLVSNTAP